MANWSGVAATLGALVRPRVLEPALRVPSIASLDFARLANEGNVVGVIIDKDNCIVRTLASPPSPFARADPAQSTPGPSPLRLSPPPTQLSTPRGPPSCAPLGRTMSSS